MDADKASMGAGVQMDVDKGSAEKREKNEKKNKRKGHYGHFTLYTARRCCFVKRFSQTVSDSAENLLHRHSHSWNCHSHSHSCAKHTLTGAPRAARLTSPLSREKKLNPFPSTVDPSSLRSRRAPPPPPPPPNPPTFACEMCGGNSRRRLRDVRHSGRRRDIGNCRRRSGRTCGTLMCGGVGGARPRDIEWILTLFLDQVVTCYMYVLCFGELAS
jgi:hypothetical protein